MEKNNCRSRYFKKQDCRLHSKNYEVFFAEANQSNILHEIGRLREITFREVGEGTNESIDLTNLTNTTTIFFFMG
jgi:hypothetical protein